MFLTQVPYERFLIKNHMWAAVNTHQWWGIASLNRAKLRQDSHLVYPSALLLFLLVLTFKINWWNIRAYCAHKCNMFTRSWNRTDNYDKKCQVFNSTQNKIINKGTFTQRQSFSGVIIDYVYLAIVHTRTFKSPLLYITHQFRPDSVRSPKIIPKMTRNGSNYDAYYSVIILWLPNG